MCLLVSQILALGLLRRNGSELESAAGYIPRDGLGPRYALLVPQQTGTRLRIPSTACFILL